MLFHILLLSGSLFFFHALGQFLMGSFNLEINRKKNIHYFTQSMVLGLLCVVGVYSLCKTFFVSINILLFFIFLLYSFYSKNIIFTFSRITINIKHISLCLLVSFLYLGFKYFDNNYFDELMINVGWDDYYYYAKTAQIFNQTGIEGRDFPSVIDFSNYRKYNTPYHYFDIWISAIFQNFNLISILEVHHYVFCPLVFTLCFFSFLSLLEYLNFGNVYLNSILAFSCIFFAGYIPFKNLSGISLYSQPRTYCGYIFTILFFIQFLKCNYVVGFTWLSLMAVSTILAAPPILTFIFLAGLYFYFKGLKKIFLYCISLSLLILTATLLFYNFFGNMNGGYNRVGEFEVFEYLKNFIFVFFRENIMRLPFYYLILSLPFFIGYKRILLDFKTNYFIYLMSLLMILLPIFFAAVFNFNVDGSSIVYYSTPASIICFLLYLMSKLEYKKRLFMSVIFLMQASLTQKIEHSVCDSHALVSKQFIKKLERNLNDGDVGAYVKNMSYATVWDFNPFVVHGFHFMGFVNRRIDLVNISDIKSENSKIISRQHIDNGEFLSFIRSKVNKGDISYIQKRFIEERGVKFIITEAEILTNGYMKNIIADSLIDNLSNYRVYFFKLK